MASIAQAVLRAERARRALLSITFVSRAAMRRLNRAHLRRDADTDVIAFAFRRATRRTPIVGDVYIAPDVARRNAGATGASAREEIIRLIVHGVLHVLGHDHPEKNRERSAMWKRQERLVKAESRRP